MAARAAQAKPRCSSIKHTCTHHLDSPPTPRENCTHDEAVDDDDLGEEHEAARDPGERKGDEQPQRGALVCWVVCVCVFVHVRVRACVRRKVGGRDEGAV